MNYKKGFTLIELLAVIVILAIIALIATPIIMNVINDAKKGAAKDSMYSYVKAVELDAAKNMKPDVDMITGEFTTVSGNLYSGATKKIDVNVKGTKPEDNSGTITLTKGRVTSASLKFDGYVIIYDGQTVELGNGSTTPPDKTYSIGEVVYFDPTGTVANCTSGKEWTPSNTSTTCYKWNVIKDNGNTIEMLVDHNITTSQWCSSADFIAAGGTAGDYGSYGNTIKGPLTALKSLKSNMSSWTKVETYTSSDNVVKTGFNSQTYTVVYNGLKARMLSGKEAAKIAGISWTSATSGTPSITSTSWLYQNLNEYESYLLDDATSDDITVNFTIAFNGTINMSNTNSAYVGLRPVIRVLKSNI